MSETISNNYSHSEEHKHRHGIGFPVLLVTIGTVLFLNSINIIPGNTWEILLRLWPVLIITGGIDGMIRREGIVASTFWTGIGGVLLLWNFNLPFFANINIWDIIRLWPLMLVAWGVDIVIGHRSLVSLAAGFAIGLALITGTIWFITTPNILKPALSFQTISQPLDGASQTSIDIDHILGKTEIKGNSEPSQLLTGKVSLSSNESYRQTADKNGDTLEYHLINELSPSTFWMPTMDYDWLLSLNPGVPTALQIKSAVGDQFVDLTGLKIENLNLSTAVGRTVLTLPENAKLRGTINVAVGEVVIYIPESASVCIDLHLGPVPILIPENYSKTSHSITSPAAEKSESCMKLTIEQGVGIFRIITKK